MKHQTEHQNHMKNYLFKNKWTLVKIFVSIFVILFFVGIIGTFVINAGFLPIKDFLEVQEPIGTSKEIDIANFMQEYPELEETPNLENINYGVFGTDVSEENIADDYKSKLTNDGYSLEYEGTGYLDECEFHYYGYLKGITAVGIVTTSDSAEEFDHDTVVMYSTGFAWDYVDILEWYQDN